MLELSVLKNLNPHYLLYFLYGLVFLFLGASTGLRDMKASKLKLAGNLWLLSAFGFTHGAHEWMHLFLMAQEKYLCAADIITIKILCIIILLVSFLSLLLFGLGLLGKMYEKPVFYWGKTAAVTCFFILGFVFSRYDFYLDPQLFIRADIIIRTTFGFWGSSVAATALLLYSIKLKKISMGIFRSFLLTATGFYFYAVFAGLMFSHQKLFFLPFPVEFFRGCCAVLITYFLMKGLNIFNVETRSKLEKHIQQLAQSEKMASLGQLAAGIAHEINTPLTNASFNIQMLLTRPEKYKDLQKIKQKLHSIEKNIDKASNIAAELLRFSHAKKLEYEYCDIHQIILNTLSALDHQLKQTSVKTVFKDLPKIYCDPDKLEQVFINVISNSIEAMTDERYMVIETSHMDDCIAISVADSGIGIPDDHFPKVFDPFFTTQKMGKGCGLGLSICFSIIEQHHGSIKIAQNKKKGTIVTIHLPVSRPKHLSDKGSKR